MNDQAKQALATKVLAKSQSIVGPESSGFKRYMALPKKMASNLMVAHYLNGNPDGTFTRCVKELFQSMTDGEFKLWVRVNA